MGDRLVKCQENSPLFHVCVFFGGEGVDTWVFRQNCNEKYFLFIVLFLYIYMGSSKHISDV